jgi:hypothetical protein
VNLAAVTSTGKTTVTNSGLLTLNGAVVSNAGFEQTAAGAGTTVLKGDITVNPNYHITFANAVELQASVALSTGTGGGNINLPQNISADTDTTPGPRTLTLGVTGNTGTVDAGTATSPGQATVGTSAVKLGSLTVRGGPVNLGPVYAGGLTTVTSSGLFTVAGDSSGDAIVSDGGFTKNGDGPSLVHGDIRTLTTGTQAISFTSTASTAEVTVNKGGVGVSFTTGFGGISVGGTFNGNEDVTLSAGV